jgi:hypothetical protein
MVHAATAPRNAPAEFDFIVVGGGTAGNVVVGRFAENPTFLCWSLKGESSKSNPQ